MNRAQKVWRSVAFAAAVTTMLVGTIGVAPGAEAAGVWVEQTPASTAGLYDVSCATSKDCVAVGLGLGIQRWNSAAWVANAVPPAPGIVDGVLLGVSCVAPGACMAVGEAGSESGNGRLVAYRLVRGDWILQSTPVPRSEYSRLSDVSCAPGPGLTHCMAVGQYFRSGTKMIGERWVAGTGWTTTTIPKPANAKAADPVGVSCPAPDACIAVGIAVVGDNDILRGFAARWDGVSWTSLVMPSTRGVSEFVLDDVSCVAIDRCVAVGVNFNAEAGPVRPLAAHWNGSLWSYRTPPAGYEHARLNGVSCVSSSSCLAVGSGALDEPLVSRFSNGSWSEEVPATTTSPLSSLMGVSCTTKDRCIAVGTGDDPAVPHIHRSS